MQILFVAFIYIILGTVSISCILGVIFIIFSIVEYIKNRNYFIDNKEIFSNEELKTLSNLTKDLEKSKKREIYEKFYKEKLRKKYIYMKQITKKIITESKVSELNIDLLNPYLKELKLTPYDEDNMKECMKEYFRKEALKQLEENIKI